MTRCAPRTKQRVNRPPSPWTLERLVRSRTCSWTYVPAGNKTQLSTSRTKSQDRELRTDRLSPSPFFWLAPLSGVQLDVAAFATAVAHNAYPASLGWKRSRAKYVTGCARNAGPVFPAMST